MGDQTLLRVHAESSFLMAGHQLAGSVCSAFSRLLGVGGVLVVSLAAATRVKAVFGWELCRSCCCWIMSRYWLLRWARAVASEAEIFAKAEGSRPVQFPMWPRRSLQPGVRHCCCLGMGLS